MSNALVRLSLVRLSLTAGENGAKKNTTYCIVHHNYK